MTSHKSLLGSIVLYLVELIHRLQRVGVAVGVALPLAGDLHNQDIVDAIDGAKHMLRLRDQPPAGCPEQLLALHGVNPAIGMTATSLRLCQATTAIRGGTQLSALMRCLWCSPPHLGTNHALTTRDACKKYLTLPRLPHILFPHIRSTYHSTGSRSIALPREIKHLVLLWGRLALTDIATYAEHAGDTGEQPQASFNGIW